MVPDRRCGVAAGRREHPPDGRPCRTGRQRLVAVDAGCEDGLRETGSWAASRLAVPQPRAQKARGAAQRTAAPPQRHVPLERIDIRGTDRLQDQAPLLEVVEELHDLPSRRPAGRFGQPAPFMLHGDELAQHGLVAARKVRAFRPQTAQAAQQVAGRGAEMALGVPARCGAAPGRVPGGHLPHLVVVEAMTGWPTLQLDGHAQTASGLLDQGRSRDMACGQIGQVCGTFLGQGTFAVTAQSARIGEQRLEHGEAPWEGHTTMSCPTMLLSRRRSLRRTARRADFAT